MELNKFLKKNIQKIKYFYLLCKSIQLMGIENNKSNIPKSTNFGEIKL